MHLMSIISKGHSNARNYKVMTSFPLEHWLCGWLPWGIH